VANVGSSLVTSAAIRKPRNANDAVLLTAYLFESISHRRPQGGVVICHGLEKNRLKFKPVNCIVQVYRERWSSQKVASRGSFVTLLDGPSVLFTLIPSLKNLAI
jgi:hypothetical protein